MLKQVKARFVIGLTATPIRKDGHHPIIMMQCGPIRFRVDVREQAALRPFEHKVIPRYTGFRIPSDTAISAHRHTKPDELGIQDIYASLVTDPARNDLIFDDARLDSLFLVMPISWRGTLQQYAGRLHRLHDKKREVQIYDYVDVHVPMLMRMYAKRVNGYKAMGYSIQNIREK